MNELQALTFRDTRDLHERLKKQSPAFERMALPEFSDYMNQQTGTQAFNAGKTDNWLMRASAGVDDLLEKTGAPQLSGDIFGAVGGMFGHEDVGRRVGETVPRGVLEMLPAFFGPVGWGVSGALSGANAYEKTGGNIPAALVSGALAGGTVPVARMAGQTALRGLGETAVRGGGELVASTVGRRLGEVGAENVAGLGLELVGGEANSLLTGQGLYNPLAPEALLETVIGNMPFTILDMHQLISPLAKAPSQPDLTELMQTVADKQAVGNLHQELPRQPVSNAVKVDEEGSVTVGGKQVESVEEGEDAIRQFILEEEGSRETLEQLHKQRSAEAAAFMPEAPITRPQMLPENFQLPQPSTVKRSLEEAGIFMDLDEATRQELSTAADASDIPPLVFGNQRETSDAQMRQMALYGNMENMQRMLPRVIAAGADPTALRQRMADWAANPDQRTLPLHLDPIKIEKVRKTLKRKGKSTETFDKAIETAQTQEQAKWGKAISPEELMEAEAIYTEFDSTQQPITDLNERHTKRIEWIQQNPEKYNRLVELRKKSLSAEWDVEHPYFRGEVLGKTPTAKLEEGRVKYFAPTTWLAQRFGSKEHTQFENLLTQYGVKPVWRDTDPTYREMVRDKPTKTAIDYTEIGSNVYRTADIPMAWWAQIPDANVYYMPKDLKKAQPGTELITGAKLETSSYFLNPRGKSPLDLTAQDGSHNETGEPIYAADVTDSGFDAVEGLMDNALTQPELAVFQGSVKAADPLFTTYSDPSTLPPSQWAQKGVNDFRASNPLPPDVDARLQKIRNDIDSLQALLEFIDTTTGIDPHKDPVEVARERTAKFILPGNKETFGGIVSPEEAVKKAVSSLGYETEVDVLTTRINELQSELTARQLENDKAADQAIQEERRQSLSAVELLSPEYAKAVGTYVKSRAFQAFSEEHVKELGIKRMKDMAEEAEASGKLELAAALHQEIDLAEGRLSRTDDYDEAKASNLDDQEEFENLRSVLTGSRVDVSDLTEAIYQRAYLAQQRGVSASEFQNTINLSTLKLEFLRKGGAVAVETYFVRDGETNEAVTPTFRTWDEAAAQAGRLNQDAGPGERYTPFNDRGQIKIKKYINIRQAMVENWDATGDAANYTPTYGVGYRENLDALAESAPKGVEDMETQEILDMVGDAEKQLKAVTHANVDTPLRMFAEAILARQKKLLASDPTVTGRARVEAALVAELLINPNFWVQSARRKVKTINTDLLIKTFEAAGVPLEVTKENLNRTAKNRFNAAMKVLNGYVKADGPMADPLMTRLLKKAHTYQEYRETQRKFDYPKSLETYEVEKAVAHFKGMGLDIDEKVQISVVSTADELFHKFPELSKEFFSQGGYAEAFYKPSANHIILVTENIRVGTNEATHEDAAHRILLHEAVGHWGIESALGPKFMGLMRQLNDKFLTDEDRKTVMARYPMITDPKDVFVPMEYLAARAEEYRNLRRMGRAEEFGTVRSFLMSIKGYAKSLAYGDGRDLGEVEVLRLLKKGRDQILKKRGLVHLVNAGEDETGPLEGRPSDLLEGDRTSFSYWKENKTYTGIDVSARNAYETMVKVGLMEGLALDEAHRKATQTRNILLTPTRYYDLKAEKYHVAHDSQLGGQWHLDLPRGTKDSWTKVRQADMLDRMFNEAFLVKDGPLAEARVRAESFFAKMPEVDRVAYLQGALKELKDRNVVGLATPENALRHLTRGLMNTVLRGSDTNFRSLLLDTPEDISGFLRAAVKEVLSINRTGVGLYASEELGLTMRKGMAPVELRALENISALTEMIRGVEVQMAKDANTLSKVSSFDPLNFMQALAGFGDGTKTLDGVADKIRASNPTSIYRRVPDELPNAPSALSRLGNLPTNIAERFPEFTAFVRTAMGYQRISQEALSEAYQHIGVEIRAGKTVKTDTYKVFERVGSAEHLRKAFSILARAQNVKVDGFANAHPEVKAEMGSGRLTKAEVDGLRQNDPHLRTLSDKDFQDTILIFEGLAKSNQRMAEVISRSYLSRSTNLAALALGHKTGWRYLDEIQLCAREMERMFSRSPGEVPTPASVLMKPTEARHVSDKDFQEIAAWLEFKMSTTYEEFANGLRERQGYFPEFRLGKFTLQYLDAEGNRQTVGAMDLKDVMEQKKALIAQGVKADDITYLAKDEARDEAQLLTKGSLEIAQEIERIHFESLRELVGPDVFDNEIKPNYEPLSAALVAQQQRTMQDYLKQRKLSRGRDSLDMFLVNMAYFPAVAYGSARSYVKTQGNFFLRDARIADNLPLKELAKTHLENVLRPAGKVEKGIREFAFQYFMALNPSTMAFELLQSASTLAPWLTRHGAGISGSYKELAEAMSLTTKAGRKGKFDDIELEVLTQRAVSEAVISRGLWQEMEDPTGAVGAVEDVMRGKHTLEQGRRLGKAYLNLTRNIYGASAYFNSRVAFTAGLLRGRRNGLMGEDLYEFAVRTVTTTMFTGGKANRAIGLYSGDAGSQPVRAMVGALQGYFAGMTGTMVRMVQDSFDPKATPRERRLARKATLQLFGTQLFLAGGLGMPGAMAAAAILEQMFPDLEIKKNVEELPKQLMGDTALGNWVVDTLLYGVPTSSSPLDVSARVGLGQVLGVNALSGFDATAAFGPVGSAVAGLGKGLKSAQQGNLLLAAEQVSPVFVKNVLKAVKDNGAIRDYSGNLVGQMSGAEQVLQGLGFRPKRIGDFVDKQRNLKRTLDIESRREGNFTRELAQELIAGNPSAVMEALRQRAKEDPLYDVDNAKRKVVQKAMAHEIPKELGRGQGFAQQAAGAIGGQMSMGPRITETERLMSQLQFEGALGLASSRLSQRFGKAQQIDQILARNPQLTVDQAKQLLAQQLSPVSQLAF